MRGIKEKITKNFSYINPVSRKLLLDAVIIFEVLFTLAVCALLLAGRGLDYWRCIQAIDPESEK